MKVLTHIHRDGRQLDPHPISSHCEPSAQVSQLTKPDAGSGELKRQHQFFLEAQGQLTS